jgi:hypothetical protein
MNKEQVLKSLSTVKLLSWEESASVHGGGNYVHFDSKKLSTSIFTLEAIRSELGRRDDNPRRQEKPKKK